MSQTNKKIYLIGVDSSDILNCTIQAIKKIENSESFIISKKFNSNYIKILGRNNKKIFYEEDLSKKKKIFLWERIFNLFDDNDTIAHIFNGDPFLEKRVTEEFNFFEKKGINCEVLPGVISFIDRLNNEFNFLTDREKNSSATIINEYCKKKVSRLISNLYFEKLIICIKSENQYNEILKMTKDNFPNNKFKINLVEKLRSNEVKEKKIPSHMFEESYIIIEYNE